MQKAILLIWGGIMVLSACQQQERARETAVNDLNRFYDLKGFFEKEVERLREMGPFTKTVSFQDSTETQQVDSLALPISLRPFMQSDINRAAWVDQYSVDSLLADDGRLRELHYQAQEQDLRVREIRLFFERNSTPEKILIEKGRESLTVDSRQRLTYIPKEGYVIVNFQDTPLSESRKMSVDVRWGKRKEQ